MTQMPLTGKVGKDLIWRAAHAVPETTSVDRNSYIAGYCAGKVVLSLGCTGPTQEIVDSVAAECYGVDKRELNRKDFVQCDLDQDPEALPFERFADLNLILLGELLEHLSNPGRLLACLAKELWPVPLLITVPNAFADVGRASLVDHAIERVNLDHVAYYSYHTLRQLLQRAGYGIAAWHWYNGPPYVAEGLIVLARVVDADTASE